MNNPFCDKKDCKHWNKHFYAIAGPFLTKDGGIEVSPCLACTEFKRQNLYKNEN